LSGSPRGPIEQPRAIVEQEEVRKTADIRAHSVALDAIRGIAIFDVFMTHLAVFWARGTRQDLVFPILGITIQDVLVRGYLGVYLFFLLSGYLLTWTEEGRARRGSYSLLSYVKRRVFRLVPAYYVTIAVVVLLWPTSPRLFDVALLMSFLHGFKPSFPVGLDPAFWSLTTEVVFYALLPLLIVKLKKFWQRAAVLVALFSVSLGTRLLMGYGSFGSFSIFGDQLIVNRMWFFPTTLLYLFIVGMLLRMMVERIGADRRPPALVLTAMTVVPVVLLVVQRVVFERQQIIASPAAMIVEALTIVLFASVLLGSPLLKPILSWRPLAFLGKISYSLFLLHTTFIYLTTRYVLFELRPWFARQDEPVLWASFLVYAVTLFAVSVAISYLSYRFIESPFLRQKPK
jgi:peptidoglycan/LPS O-acetylase OafA/YrhL